MRSDDQYLLRHLLKHGGSSLDYMLTGEQETVECLINPSKYQNLTKKYEDIKTRLIKQKQYKMQKEREKMRQTGGSTGADLTQSKYSRSNISKQVSFKPKSTLMLNQSRHVPSQKSQLQPDKLSRYKISQQSSMMSKSSKGRNRSKR